MASDSTNFRALVEAIVASYDEQPATRHIDAGHLPNRDAIIELIKLIRELLFPGYFGKQNLTAAMLEYHVGELLTQIHDRLYQQVHNAIRHQAMRRGERLPHLRFHRPRHRAGIPRHPPDAPRHARHRCAGGV